MPLSKDEQYTSLIINKKNLTAWQPSSTTYDISRKQTKTRSCACFCHGTIACTDVDTVDDRSSKACTTDGLTNTN